MIINEIRLQNNKTYKLNILNPDGLNEAIIIETKLGYKSFLFLIDTGYAGPPVLSRNYLAVRDNDLLNLKDRYNDIMQQMNNVQEDDEHRALNEYINKCGCLPYTSGCTMKLMGIGSTMEQQADMLMCPMLRIKTNAIDS